MNLFETSKVAAVFGVFGWSHFVVRVGTAVYLQALSKKVNPLFCGSMVIGVTPGDLVCSPYETSDDLFSISGLEQQGSICLRTGQGCCGETIRLEFVGYRHNALLELVLDGMSPFVGDYKVNERVADILVQELCLK